MSTYSDSSNANIFANVNKVSFATALAQIKQRKILGDEWKRPEEFEHKPKPIELSYDLFSLDKIPETQKQMTKNQFERKMQVLVDQGSLTKLVNTTSIVQFGKNKNSIQTNKLKYQIIAGDKEMLGIFFGNPKFRTMEMKQMMEEVNKTIASGGTDEGQFNRLILGLSHNAAVGKKGKLMETINGKIGEFDDIDRIEMLLRVIKWKQPMDVEGKLRYLKGKLGIDFDPTINQKANAGYPFSVENKGEVMEEINELFEELCQSFSKPMTRKEIAAYDIKNSTYTTAKCKNKTEVIEIAEQFNKVRTYFVLPAHLCLPFSVIQSIILDGLADNSFFMCGFSWAKQGANNLIKLMTDKTKWDNLPFMAKVYSDDTHVSFKGVNKMGEESYYLMCMDVKYLDLSLRSENEQLFINVLKAMLRDENGKPIYDVMFENFIIYNCYKSINSWIDFPHGLKAYKTESLISGLPGTTTFGSIATINPMIEIMIILDKKYPKHVFPIEEVECLFVETYKKYGFKLKENTEKAFPIDMDAEVGTILPMKILGQNIEKIEIDGEKMWMNKPDKQNCLISLIRPTKLIPKEKLFERRRYGMERVVGCMVSGGWLYDDLYQMCKMYYEKAVSEGVHFNQENLASMAMLNGTEEAAEYLQINMFAEECGIAPPFPSKKFFSDIYTKSTFIKQIINTLPAGVIKSESKVQDEDDLIAQLLGEGATDVIIVPVTKDPPKDFKIEQNIKPILPPSPMSKAEKKHIRKEMRKPKGIKRVIDYNNQNKINGYFVKNGKVVKIMKRKNPNYDEESENWEDWDEDLEEEINVGYDMPTDDKTMYICERMESYQRNNKMLAKEENMTDAKFQKLIASFELEYMLDEGDESFDAHMTEEEFDEYFSKTQYGKFIDAGREG